MRTGVYLLSDRRDYGEGDVKRQKRQEVKVLVISNQEAKPKEQGILCFAGSKPWYKSVDLIAIFQIRLAKDLFQVFFLPFNPINHVIEKGAHINDNDVDVI